MPREIAHHFAAAGGMADVNRILQIEMRGDRREVVGVMVHVMTGATLAGAAMAAAVMGDNAEAVIEEEQHLRIPIVRRQRPTVAEHNRLARAPILIEYLGAVLGRNRRHTKSPVHRIARTAQASAGILALPRSSGLHTAPRAINNLSDSRPNFANPHRLGTPCT